LRLSLVTCPVALYPATSDSEKISFNQINKKTGHRIKYVKVDADTGEEVSSDEITKGYKVDTDTYIEVSKDELENIALESTRTIDINEVVPKADIDPRYLIRPYYLVPDGKVGTTALPSSGKPSATWKWLLLVAWFLPAASTKVRREDGSLRSADAERRAAPEQLLRMPRLPCLRSDRDG
jgi:hypothetical protein